MRKYLLHICFPVLFALIISFVFAFKVSAFDKTDFEKAKDSNADLSNADLREADLSGADLSGTDLSFVNLSGADLSGADLTQVISINGLSRSINKLSEVETLYKAKLDPELMEQVKDKYPHLLKKPKSEESF